MVSSFIQRESLNSTEMKKNNSELRTNRELKLNHKNPKKASFWNMIFALQVLHLCALLVHSFF